MPGVIWQGCDVDNSSPPNTKFKKEWSYASVPPVCLRANDRENFTFFLRVIHFGAQWLKIKLDGEISEYVLMSFERVYLARHILVCY